jgi:hypothetical protein
MARKDENVFALLAAISGVGFVFGLALFTYETLPLASSPLRFAITSAALCSLSMIFYKLTEKKG